MIKHCVFCSFRQEVPEQERMSAVKAFEVLAGQVKGFVAIEAGPNKDFENKTGAYSHGFVISFTDIAALNEYAEHPVHQQLGAELVSKCEGGADGILVFDLDVSS